MNGQTNLNGVLIVCAGLVAAAVWAGALLLPAGPPAPAPQADFAMAQPEAAQNPAPAPRADAPAVAKPAIDAAAFGGLPANVTPVAPAPPARASMLEGVAPFALSLATPLHSIAATFSEPVEGALAPELGGPSALDGPADAGLESPVQRASSAEPSAPPPTGKIIALDASEGTKIDPLLQRNWDLNAVQNVPPLNPPR